MSEVPLHRGALVCKAHRPGYHATLGFVIKKKQKNDCQLLRLPALASLLRRAHACGVGEGGIGSRVGPQSNRFGTVLLLFCTIKSMLHSDSELS